MVQGLEVRLRKGGTILLKGEILGLIKITWSGVVQADHPIPGHSAVTKSMTHGQLGVSAVFGKMVTTVYNCVLRPYEGQQLGTGGLVQLHVCSPLITSSMGFQEADLKKLEKENSFCHFPEFLEN